MYIKLNNLTESWILALFISLGTLNSNAQRRGPSGGSKCFGEVKGRIQDSLSGRPLEYATITLKASKKPLRYGAISDKGGYFLIDSVQCGMYSATFDFIGYNAKTTNGISINFKQKEVVISTELKESVNAIQSSTISASRNPVTRKLDKTVINVDDVIGSETSTTTEVLKNSSSVDVDLDGNVSMRGSLNLRVLVDGKPINSTGDDGSALDNIPTASIERIEIITAPSAKYDPDGTAGIINVILKKNRKEGSHGSIIAGIGTQPGANLGFNFSGKTGKTTYFVNANAKYQDSWREGNTTSINPNVNTLIQESYGDRIRINYALSAGVEQQMNPFNTIGVSVRRNYRLSDNSGYNENTNTANNLQYTKRFSDEIDWNITDGFNVFYKKKFAKGTKNLVVDFDFRTTENEENVDIVENITDQLFELIGTNLIQNNLNILNRNQFVGAIDYIDEDWHGMTLEGGLKSIRTDIDNDFDATDENLINGDLVLNTNLSNRLIYQEWVNAAYTTLGKKWKKFGLKGGLRYEYVLTSATLKETADSFVNDYQSLFPTMAMQYQLNKKTSLRFTYTRRINRPRSRQLNPFTDYSNPYRLRVGNPFLKPEYSNNFELGMSKRGRKSGFSTDVYFRNVNNPINRFISINDSNVTTVSYQNFGYSRSLGIEGNVFWRPNKWYRVTVIGNVYQNVTSGNVENTQLDNTAINWFLRTMNSFELSKGWSSQLSYFYNAPRVFAQGRIEAMHSASIALKKTFDNRLSLSLNIRDPFNTREFNFSTRNSSFDQSARHKRLSRTATFSVMYPFGKNAQKRTRDGQERESGGEDFGL